MQNEAILCAFLAPIRNIPTLATRDSTGKKRRLKNYLSRTVTPFLLDLHRTQLTFHAVGSRAAESFRLVLKGEPPRLRFQIPTESLDRPLLLGQFGRLVLLAESKTAFPVLLNRSPRVQLGLTRIEIARPCLKPFNQIGGVQTKPILLGRGVIYRWCARRRVARHGSQILFADLKAWAV